MNIGKSMLCGALALACAGNLAASETKSDPKELAKLIPQETRAERDARMAWWTESRFGLFIHFGLYATPARGEWIKTLPEERGILVKESYAKYFKYFNPDQFDAKAWAKAAKAAGMRYAVLTAKHHEGFCLFDSKFTDYKITNTAFGRDLVKEFVEAFRAEGIRVGLYYSLIDWHHPDFTIDMHHPERPGDPKFWPDPRVTPADFEKANAGRDMAKYRAYMMNQIRELLTNYGRIDIVWYDFSYPGVIGKGRDDWDSAAILKLTRELMPGVLVDNRLDMRDVPGGQDFITPEQTKAPEWPTLNGERFPWETCQTFSGSWGYSRDEMTWKSPAQLIELLAETVSKGGNLIMNVGPTARGRFDARALDRLAAFGKWMDANSRAIYGCTQAPDEFKAPTGSILTYNPKTRRLYVILKEYPMGRLMFEFDDKVDFAQFLHDGSEIKLKRHPYHQGTAGFAGGREVCDFVLPMVKPDVELPVIEVMLK